MSLNLAKLENVRSHSGKTTARCPACAESGADKSGGHLVILENGKWGCIAFSGPTGHDHRRRIAELVGDGSRDAANRPQLRQTPPKPVCKPTRLLPALRVPSAEELRQIATVRRWPTSEGLDELVKRGLLFAGAVYDYNREWLCWIVTDSTRANAQARRFDGEKFIKHDIKAKTLPGTSARVPITHITPDHTEVYIVEGPPDLLALAVILRMDGRDLAKIGFVCITGAGNSLGAVACQLDGKRVVIAQDADTAGREAAARWAQEAYNSGAREVVGFTYAEGTKDLAEHLEQLAIPETMDDSGIVPSAPARPPLVPLETPWTEGGRYRFANCYDLHRLPLFVVDPIGDTRRAHGVLIHDPLY